MKLCICAIALGVVISPPVSAQWWDLSAMAQEIPTQTEGKLKIGLESRARFETRTGQSFGSAPDNSTGLFRTRLSLTFTPVSWLKVSGMVQDARAPWYGPNAPASIRDPADLHEAYFELFPDAKTGFGMAAGRKMLNYGEGRLIGTPQWGNLSRTYDHARVYYRASQATVEFLLVSPVKVLTEDFNKPVLGDRVWGTYSVFSNIGRKNSLDVYALRHDQNRIGGFTAGNKAAGTDRLSVNTFGARLSGPISPSLKYAVEAIGQTGKTGPTQHRAWAWSSWITRRWTAAGKPLDVTAEYKYASGTRDPKTAGKDTTFDQLYPANHDKFGHQDLFGWRNLHDLRSLATLGVTKNFALNCMYNDYWLASARDGLYNGSGKQIVRSATGAGGRHVGQASDLFATYKHKVVTVGAGVGRFFNGEYVKRNTPGVAPTYAYVFETYSF